MKHLIDIFPYIFEFAVSDLPVAILVVVFISVIGISIYGARRVEEN